MSRGMHVGYPSKLTLPGTIDDITYDGSRFVIVSAGGKICLVDWFAIPTETAGLAEEKDWDLALHKTINVGISLTNLVYKDGFVYGTSTDKFSQIYKINLVTGENTSISLPTQMYSNIVIHNEYILMISEVVRDGTDDFHKMYRYNMNTGAFNYTTLPGKKAKEKFYIWEFGYRNVAPFTGKIYVSLWSNFGFGVIDGTTFNYLSTVELNGYPVYGAYSDGANWWVGSYAGMLSLVNGLSYSVTNGWSTGDTPATALAYEHGTANIWFINGTGVLGRIETSTNDVIDTNSSGTDYNILSSSDAKSITNTEVVREAYSGLPTTGYTHLISTPKFNINYISGGNQQQKTIFSRIIASKGSDLYSFNSNDVEFVFDKPDEQYSYLSTSGSAMVGSGETDYIGEFL